MPKEHKPLLLRWADDGQIECGCDEAGRGCLAGPVFAAAVILPPDFRHPWLNDSKQLTERRRDALRPIIETEAVAWAVAECSPEEIDQINILHASFRAMHCAIDGLEVRPERLLIDGNRFDDYPGIAHRCIVHGDALYSSIAAASILAKTHRDERMKQLAADYPVYQWADNKGYPTEAHRAAVQIFGLSPHHRKTFCRSLLDF